ARAGVLRIRSVTGLSQQWHVGSKRRDLPEVSEESISRLDADNRWPGAESQAALPRTAADDEGEVPNHPPRLRRGLERDRKVDGRSLERSIGLGTAATDRALRGVSLCGSHGCRRHALLRKYRPGGCSPSADDSRLRTERRGTASQERRADPSAYRAPT